LDTTLSSDILRMRLTLQSVEGGTHHVVGVGGAERLRNNVLNPENLEDRAHRTTGDDTGTSLGGTQQDLTSAVSAVNVVVERTTFTQRNENHVTLCSFRRLADGFRHFACL